VAVVIAWLWLNELPILPELVGCAIVIAGVVVISRGERILGQFRRSSRSTQAAKPLAHQ